MKTKIEKVTVQDDFVTLDNVKKYLRISYDDDDIILLGMIRSAISYCDQYLGFAISNREEILRVEDYRPGSPIYLGKTNSKISIISVVSDNLPIEYDFKYDLLTVSDHSDFTVTYTVTPELTDRFNVISACYMIVASMYEHRGDDEAKTDNSWRAIHRLLDMVAVIQV